MCIFYIDTHVQIHLHPLHTQAGTATPHTPSGHSGQAVAVTRGHPQSATGSLGCPSSPPSVLVCRDTRGLPSRAGPPRSEPSLGFCFPCWELPVLGAGPRPPPLRQRWECRGEMRGEGVFHRDPHCGVPGRAPLVPSRHPPMNPRALAGPGWALGPAPRARGHRGRLESDPRSSTGRFGCVFSDGKKCLVWLGVSPAPPSPGQGGVVPTVASAPTVRPAALGWEGERKGARGAG